MQGEEQKVVTEFATQVIQNFMKNGLGVVGSTIYDSCQVYKYCPPSEEDLQRFLGWLVEQQQDDGGWHVETERIDFRFIATLAALSMLIREKDTKYQQSVERGKQYCIANKSFLENFQDLVDMAVAFELIVVKLIEEIDFGSELILSDKLVGQYKKYRMALAARTHYKDKYLHCIEAWHSGSSVSNDWLKPNGSVVCTPSATAYWLHHKLNDESCDRDRDLIEKAKEYMRSSANVTETGVTLYPNAYPMPNFEVAFTLQFMLFSGLSQEAALRQSYEQWGQKLREMVGEAPVGIYKDYFPVDCDDTACAYSVFFDQGISFPVKNMDIFDKQDHFITFEDEFQVSISATCRAVYLYRQLGRDVTKYQDYIVSKQHKDGYWRDKWHLSRLYTTFLASLVLDPVRHQDSMTRAVRYIVNTQTEQGGWHGYNPNASEAAEAVFCLHNYLQAMGDSVDVTLRDNITSCLSKAKTYFEANPTVVPTLWIDKDGYSMPVVDDAIHLCSKYILYKNY